MIEPLTAKQVADRLGVELATVYAYASRGSLTRLPGPDGRSSAYDADEVEALARRARPRSTRRRVGAVDVVIGTTVSEIGDGWIRYRDHDLIDLASWATFEDVSTLLWTGDLPDIDPVGDRHSPTNSTGADTPHEVDRDREAMLDAVQRVSVALPSKASVSARLAAGAAAASVWVPRAKTTESSVRSASLVIDALIASLPRVDTAGDGPTATSTATPIATPIATNTKPGDLSVAARLWPRISALPATPARIRALDTTLVLMAEHELATSTLAVRVAASTRAKPAEAVLAGLGTMSGPFHGRAAVRVHRRLVEGLGPADTTMLDGFGHPVHEVGDPRFAPMLAAVLDIADPGRREIIERYVTPTKGSDPPNCDAALGALGFAAEADPGMTEAIFAIARTAGWLAHAFEEADEAPVRFRGRTLYRGPR